MFITDEKLQKALDEMKSQGFELGKVYSNPSNIKHLQHLIEAGERCYPKDGMRPIL